MIELKILSPNANTGSAQGQPTEMVCKLTPPELQYRKATVLAALRQKVQARQELENG